MTSASELTPAAPAAAPVGARERLGVYIRLTKAWMYYHWAPVVVAWTLLPAAAASDATNVVALALAALAAMLGCSAAGALDDVQGYVDGIDQRTYARGQDLRKAMRKPIVRGEIGVEEARRIGLALAALAVACGVAAFAIGPHRPAWLFLIFVAVAALGIQYSYGLRTSYVVGNEVVLGVGTGLTLALPYILITGGLSWTAAIESALIGLLMTQVTIFSNSADVDVDRENERMTVAARLTADGNRRFVTAVFATSWALAVAATAVGELSVWVLVALVPCWLLQVRQLQLGVGRGEWLRGRALGWRAFDLGLLALVAGNLLDIRIL